MDSICFDSIIVDSISICSISMKSFGISISICIASVLMMLHSNWTCCNDSLNGSIASLNEIVNKCKQCVEAWWFRAGFDSQFQQSLTYYYYSYSYSHYFYYFHLLLWLNWIKIDIQINLQTRLYN